MADFLQVVAPVVILRDLTGAQHYLYQGAVVPSGLDGDHVKQLLDEKMLTKVEVIEAVTEKPAKAASKGDWETFALSQGATADDLDGMTKDELVAAYGD